MKHGEIVDQIISQHKENPGIRRACAKLAYLAGVVDDMTNSEQEVVSELVRYAQAPGCNPHTLAGNAVALAQIRTRLTTAVTGMEGILEACGLLQVYESSKQAARERQTPSVVYGSKGDPSTPFTGDLRVLDIVHTQDAQGHMSSWQVQVLDGRLGATNGSQWVWLVRSTDGRWEAVSE